MTNWENRGEKTQVTTKWTVQGYIESWGWTTKSTSRIYSALRKSPKLLAYASPVTSSIWYSWHSYFWCPPVVSPFSGSQSKQKECALILLALSLAFLLFRRRDIIPSSFRLQKKSNVSRQLFWSTARVPTAQWRPRPVLFSPSPSGSWFPMTRQTNAALQPFFY